MELSLVVLVGPEVVVLDMEVDIDVVVVATSEYQIELKEELRASRSLLSSVVVGKLHPVNPAPPATVSVLESVEIEVEVDVVESLAELLPSPPSPPPPLPPPPPLLSVPRPGGHKGQFGSQKGQHDEPRSEVPVALGLIVLPDVHDVGFVFKPGSVVETTVVG